jgi:hypothetical protein
MFNDGPSIGLPAEYPKPRNAITFGGHGPGMHSILGAMLRLRFENVSDPEQPLKSWPSVMVVTASSGEIVKEMGLPWAVVPLH